MTPAKCDQRQFSFLNWKNCPAMPPPPPPECGRLPHLQKNDHLCVLQPQYRFLQNDKSKLQITPWYDSTLQGAFQSYIYSYVVVICVRTFLTFALVFNQCPCYLFRSFIIPGSCRLSFIRVTCDSFDS